MDDLDLLKRIAKTGKIGESDGNMPRTSALQISPRDPGRRTRMSETREMAEHAQKLANALFALADAEDKGNESAIESATKDLLYESAMMGKIMT